MLGKSVVNHPLANVCMNLNRSYWQVWPPLNGDYRTCSDGNHVSQQEIEHIDHCCKPGKTLIVFRALIRHRTAISNEAIPAIGMFPEQRWRKTAVENATARIGFGCMARLRAEHLNTHFCCKPRCSARSRRGTTANCAATRRALHQALMCSNRILDQQFLQTSLKGNDESSGTLLPQRYCR